MTDTVLIETKALTKSFGSVNVLKGVDVQVHQGEALAIIGPSGGGKSTFLRCLNLLEQPDGGEVIFEGQKINQKGVDVDKKKISVDPIRALGEYPAKLSLFEGVSVTVKVIVEE